MATWRRTLITIQCDAMCELDNDDLYRAVIRAIELETGTNPGGFILGWSMIGPLLVRNNIALSPPTSPVHRNGGPNAGNGPSRYWSAHTWHRGVTGRRAIGHHETEPFKAILRCYVTLILGDDYGR